MTPIQTLIDMYTKQHLTIRQIGALTGRSGVSVWKRLRRAGIKASDGTMVDTPCDYCGKVKQVPRYRWRHHKKHYCNNDCKGLAMYSDRFLTSTKLARALVNQYFHLQPEHVVYSRTGVYEKADLLVFENEDDYLNFCKGRKVTPLWDGSIKSTL